MQLPTAKMEKQRKRKRETVPVNSVADDLDIDMSHDEEDDNDSIHSDTTYDDINNDDVESGDDKSDDEESGPDVSEAPAAGMADVIAKLLRKSIPEGKTPILYKAKTERELQKRKKKVDKKKVPEIIEVKMEDGSEVQMSDDEDASASDDGDDDIDDDKEKVKKLKQLTQSEQLKKKKEWEDMGRVRPSLLERETERGLQRIATKGVVQLFNAVKKQQALNDEKADDPTALSAKVKCGKFLDMLQTKSKSKQKKEELKDEEVKEEEDDSTWSILRDDFMLGSTMKDWDKDVDS